jgi:hypothetical protein
MKTWVRKSLNVGVLSAGFLLVAGTAAHADSNTGNNAGAANGNQLDTKVSAPVDVHDNALGLFGFAAAGGSDTESATANNAGGGDWNTGMNAGGLTGNQLSTVVHAPVTVSDNAVSVLGFANAGGGNESATEATKMGGATADNAGGEWNTGNNAGALTGNQASTVLQVPVNACGNAISVLGFADASCGGGTTASNAGGSGEGAMNTGFSSGVGTGNQLTTVLQAPINLCGNAIAVGGFASADCDGGATGNNGGDGGGNGGGDGNGGGNGGYGGGNGGSNGGYGNGGSNSYGQSHAARAHGKAKKHTAMEKTSKKGNSNGAFAGGGATANNAGGGDWNTGMNAGALTGNELSTVVQAPVNVSNNAIGALGFASA